MSGDWTPRSWRPEEPRERLPRVQDLPLAGQGYERRAVEEAFDAFHRHAAQLDATLRVLESLETFNRQAGELRADIRTLRSSAWGPVPIQPAWEDRYRSTAYRFGHAEPGVGGALPRLALEAVFIVLVAVAAALAELETTMIIVSVLAAWAIVGLAEVAVFAVRGRRATAVPFSYAPSATVVEPVRSPLRAEASVHVGEDTAPDLRVDPWERESEPAEEQAPPEPRRLWDKPQEEAEGEAAVAAEPSGDGHVEGVDAVEAIAEAGSASAAVARVDPFPQPQLPAAAIPRARLRRGRR